MNILWLLLLPGVLSMPHLPYIGPAPAGRLAYIPPPVYGDAPQSTSIRDSVSLDEPPVDPPIPDYWLW
ncbi:hypothetical protein Aduo_019837 [Ancylostoma duodenale]